MPNTKKQKKIKRPALKFKRLPKGANGGVQVLLICNVENLGKQGDVVEVRPGYANNFLIPQGMATVATAHHKRMVEKHKERLEQLRKERSSTMRLMAEQIRKISLNIVANANQEGHLYGSVGAVEIVEALKKQNITIEENHVCLAGAIRELGLYTIKISLGKDIKGSDVESELKLWIVPPVSE